MGQAVEYLSKFKANIYNTEQIVMHKISAEIVHEEHIVCFIISTYVI